MWFLNKTSQHLKAISAEAITTTALDFTVVYHSKSGNLNYGPQTEGGTITDALTTIVDAPPTADHQFDVKTINVNNTDTIAHNLTFYLSDGSNRVIFKCKLQADWSAIWEQETGWKIFDEDGIQLTMVPSIDLASATGVLTPIHGGTGVANNNSNTITFAGAYPLAITLTNNTTVTFPVSGTLSTLAGAEAFTNKVSYNGLVITANTGVVTSGTWQGTSISTTYTDAKIKGAVAASNRVVFGNGTADAVTDSANLTYNGAGLGIFNTAATVPLCVGTRGGTTGNVLLSEQNNATNQGAYILWDAPVLGGVSNTHIAKIKPRGTWSATARNTLCFYVGSFNNNQSVGNEKFILTDEGKVCINSTALPNAFLEVIGTTEQVRTAYDTSNYYKTTVGSTGLVTFDAVGTGAGFAFSDAITLSDVNVILGTTTGTKIGTGTTQKLGFWNATPIVQPTTAVGAATYVSNAGTGLTDADTFDGYTLKQVVKALRNTGLLA